MLTMVTRFSTWYINKKEDLNVLFSIVCAE